MLRKTGDRIIVLRQFPYKDNRRIVEAFTESSGRKSFGLHVGKSKASASRRSVLRPPNLVEIEFTESSRFHPRITSAAWVHPYKSVYFDMRKTATALFMAEILLNVSSAPEPELFKTAWDMFVRLDEEDYRPDFHLEFLRRFTELMGILPPEWEKGTIFDASFSVKPVKNIREMFAYYIEHGRTRNRHDRYALTRGWLDYLSYHLENFRTPASFRIYHRIFDEKS